MITDDGDMRTADFNFELPPELIAQTPAPRRDASRLLVLDRASGKIEHRQFRDVLNFFRAGDVLVLNNSRVIPARLRGVNAKSGGAFEILLLEENAANDWWAMVRPGKRARVGTEIILNAERGTRNAEPETKNQKLETISATVAETNDEGHRRLQFSGTKNIFGQLDELGEVPLPPYIRRDAKNPEGRVPRVSISSKKSGARGTHPSEEENCDDRERYQTVFAEPAGSVAAPTAGLHFTESLLEEIRARGVEICFVTLHVGPGTFLPVKTENVAAHKMHEERYELSAETARIINQAKQQGRRVIAVGTTSVRVLESAAASESGECRVTGGEKSNVASPVTRHLSPTRGRTHIFIYPPREFKIVDALLTNFHLPCSTLLMLVSAFAAPGKTTGRELVLSAYAEAIRERYRFFSYGDAMLLL